MTDRDDIIRMAREAGLHSAVLLHIYDGREAALTDSERDELRKLERFFTLAYEAGAAAERNRMIADGWRQCAQGQRTTQFCAVAEQALEAMEYSGMDVGKFNRINAACAALRAALAQQAEPVQEPVAVPLIDYEALIAAAYAANKKWAQGTNGCVAFKHGAEWFRLQTLAAPAQRKPLTDAEIPALAEQVLKLSVYYDVWALLGTDGLVALVRAVEQAHGIKE